MTITVTFAQSFNSNLDITNSPGAGPTTAPAVLGLANGGWVAAGTDGAQTILNGSAGGLLATTVAQIGTGAALAELTDGRILVVTDTGSGMRIGLYATAGLGSGSTTIESAPGESAFSAVALPGGGFVVASEAQVGGGTDVFLRYFDTTGSVTFVTSVLPPSPVNERAPSVAARPDGTVCMVWEQQNGASTEIWYALYDAFGNPVLAPTLLDGFGTINRAPIVVATDAGFAVAYEDDGWSTGGTDITLATISATGAFGSYYNISNPSVAPSALNETATALVHLGDNVVALAYAADTGAGGTANDTLTVIADLNTDTFWPPNGVGGGGLNILNDVTAPVIGLVGNGILHVYQQDQTANDITGESFRLIRFQQSDAADDTMLATRLADSFVGGGGFDVVDYSASQTAVTVNLGTGLGAGGAAGDVLIDIRGLIGTGFDDRLTGGSGAEFLYGGNGNDTFIDQDGINDDWHEGGGGVGDWVDYRLVTLTNVFFNLEAGQAFVVGGNAERLLGIENVRASQGSDGVYGNNLDNVLLGEGGNDQIYGGGGNDTLNGGTGNDTLAGGIGNDLIYVDNAADIVEEFSSFGTLDRVAAAVSFMLAADDAIEQLQTTAWLGTGAINLTGNALAQQIFGNAGANRLEDGPGLADTLTGGLGNDTYVVRNAGTLIAEGSGGGTADAVFANVSFVLAADDNIELLATLSVAGTTAINLTGNTRAQVITGNAGVNVLNDGGSGAADTLRGLAGDDVYRIFNSGDIIDETAGNGTVDRIQTTVSFALAADDNIEIMTTLVPTGVVAINLSGNALNQTIIGNSGANSINGGAGIDTLTGGLGADRFVFTSPTLATNIDRITDFNVASDTIVLENLVFPGLPAGGLALAAFAANLTGFATDALDRIIYETDTGRLFYDFDGTSAGAKFQFAVLAPGLALSQFDFLVV